MTRRRDAILREMAVRLKHTDERLHAASGGAAVAPAAESNSAGGTEEEGIKT